MKAPVGSARRRWLQAAAMAAGTAATPRLAAAVPYPGEPHHHPSVDPGRALRFPRDFGAHPDFRTEWWYVTGWLSRERLSTSATLDRPGAQELERGFQVTFFRVRTAHPAANPSRFAPTELVFAHAALMDPANKGPLHAQRAARRGSPGVECSDRDTDVRIGDWRLVRGADDRYHAVVREATFGLDLRLAPPGSPGEPAASPWLQGDAGFSRKGPQPHQASRYYSRPQLQVTGTADGRPTRGVAWFDHEWSTTVLDPAAAGWDWTGINFHDGSALVAFRIRPREGGEAAAPLWRYCALRDADGRSRIIEDVRFEPLRHWQSPRSGARYPVALRIDLPGRSLRLQPLMDDQELDGRGSTGTIYWEGAVRVSEADGRESGLGYLELTGYRDPFRL